MESTDTVIEKSLKLSQPKKWKVIVHNDDVTSMEFVVALLYYVFNLNEADATALMQKIHHEGFGVAGIYPYEIADQKRVEGLAMARLYGMPLNITIEEE